MPAEGKTYYFEVFLHKFRRQIIGEICLARGGTHKIQPAIWDFQHKLRHEFETDIIVLVLLCIWIKITQNPRIVKVPVDI